MWFSRGGDQVSTVLVLCGAGASSTFLAHALRRQANVRGLTHTFTPASIAALSMPLASVDVVLVSSHVSDFFDQAEEAAVAIGARAIQLPVINFNAAGADIALDLLDAFPTRQQKAATMAEQTIRVASSHGLHARPASLFTQAAAASGLDVTIAKGDKSVNASSILSVISLGVSHGDEVTISAEGDGADAVIAELTEILSTDHDEN